MGWEHGRKREECLLGAKFKIVIDDNFGFSFTEGFGCR
jgi:hypothetical protein